MQHKKNTKRSLLALGVVALLAMTAMPTQAQGDPTDSATESTVLEPRGPEGYEFLDPNAETTGEPPVFEDVPAIVPGNGPDISPDTPEGPDLPVDGAMSHGSSSCSFSGSNGSSGTEFVGTYEPFGSAGYTGSDANNWYKVFYRCRTTWSDSSGYRYVFIVTKDRQNSGPDNHVLSTIDHNGVGYYTANHNQWKEAGRSQSIVDISPDSETSFGDGDTVSFSLGYGGASVGWSHTFSDGVIKIDYWSGAKVHWHTNSHEWYCCGKTGWTSTYGAVQKTPEGTYAATDWWAEVRFHHYGSADHAHLFGSPCTGVDCGHNRMNTWAGGSSSSGGGGSGGGSTNGGSCSTYYSSSAGSGCSSDPCRGTYEYKRVSGGYCYKGRFYKY